MRKHTTTVKKLTDDHYAGLKADQARALFLIANAGAEGLTDEQLAGFNEAGEPVQEGEKGLKVKMALLATGLLKGENVATTRKSSERTYQYTGVALGDDLSAGLKQVGEAVRTIGTGTRTQFAEQLVRDAEARGETLELEKAVKTVNGIWLRLHDRGIIVPVKKADAQAAAPQETQAPQVEGEMVSGDTVVE